MLIACLAVELAGLALIGGVAGVVSGYLLAGVLLPDVAASLRGLYGAEVAGQLSLSLSWWFSGIGLSLIGALLAGANSLLRAARLPLLALADPQAWHEAHARWLRRQGWVAALAGVIALLALIFGDSLISGFVLMAALLIGAALALPVMLQLAAQSRFAAQSLGTRPVVCRRLPPATAGVEPGLDGAAVGHGGEHRCR